MAIYGKKKLTDAERTEREEKKLKEQNERKKQLETEAFNRRVNYFVMRYMWQVIHKRSANDTIYNAFGMSRERYTRIIDTGVVRYRKDELNFLETKVGISRKIFSGEEIFICHDKKSGDELISRGDWENLLNLRDARKEAKAYIEGTRGDSEEERLSAEAAYITSRVSYSECEAVICNKLKGASRNGHSEFNKLCSFLKSGHAAKANRLNELKRALRLMSFSVLDECTIQELDELFTLLNGRSDLTRAVLTYKKAQNKK